jgi:DNA ligase-1
VIGHEAGKGRLHSTLGALLVREESGCEFKIGSGFDDKQRENPPEIGSVVTFKF